MFSCVCIGTFFTKCFRLLTIEPKWDLMTIEMQFTLKTLVVVCVSVSIFNKFNILCAVQTNSIINVWAILKD